MVSSIGLDTTSTGSCVSLLISKRISGLARASALKEKEENKISTTIHQHFVALLVTSYLLGISYQLLSCHTRCPCGAF